MKISSNNSTATPLEANGIYTGTSDDVYNYTSITINIISNVVSIENGIVLEFSLDNSNWYAIEYYTLQKNKLKTIHISVKARYFRIIYNNNVFAQSFFRIQTIFHFNKSIDSTTVKFGQNRFVSGQTEGTLVGAVCNNEISSIISGDSNFAPLQVNANGELKIDRTEFIEMKHLLTELIEQQKITNMYLQKLSDEYFTSGDIE